MEINFSNRTTRLFRTRWIDTFCSLKPDVAMRTVAKRLVRGRAAAAECKARFINCNSVSIRIEEINWTFDDVWSVLRRTNSYVCHCYSPLSLLCETSGRILTWQLVLSFEFRVSSSEFRFPSFRFNVEPETLSQRLQLRTYDLKLGTRNSKLETRN